MCRGDCFNLRGNILNVDDLKSEENSACRASMLICFVALINCVIDSKTIQRQALS